jgi:thiamine kinase-like enzyme
MIWVIVTTIVVLIFLSLKYLCKRFGIKLIETKIETASPEVCTAEVARLKNEINGYFLGHFEKRNFSAEVSFGLYTGKLTRLFRVYDRLFEFPESQPSYSVWLRNLDEIWASYLILLAAIGRAGAAPEDALTATYGDSIRFFLDIRSRLEKKAEGQAENPNRWSADILPINVQNLFREARRISPANPLFSYADAQG